MGKLFTVGHSQHTPEYFINLLKRHNINCVLDVRSTPYSKYAEQFNRENVHAFLQNSSIRYSYMGKYFGARPTELKLYNNKDIWILKKLHNQNDLILG